MDNLTDELAAALFNVQFGDGPTRCFCIATSRYGDHSEVCTAAMNILRKYEAAKAAEQREAEAAVKLMTETRGEM